MKTTLRSIVVVSTSLVASVVVVLAACGFPSPALLDTSGDVGGMTSDSGTDAAVASDAPENPPNIESDAAITDAAAEKVDTTGCMTCDCDNDGYPRANCDAGPWDGGYDCMDDYPDIHPGQQDFSTQENPPNQGDRNCDNNVERFRKTNFKCDGFLASDCNKREGYTGDPACGTASAYVHCKAVLTNCVVDTAVPTEYPFQACR